MAQSSSSSFTFFLLLGISNLAVLLVIFLLISYLPISALSPFLPVPLAVPLAGPTQFLAVLVALSVWFLCAFLAARNSRKAMGLRHLRQHKGEEIQSKKSKQPKHEALFLGISKGDKV